MKWFNVKAGFGFINRNDNGQDVYVHYSSIENKNPNHRVRSLADGELVKFNIIEGIFLKLKILLKKSLIGLNRFLI